jgi:hypothetical protein
MTREQIAAMLATAGFDIAQDSVEFAIWFSYINEIEAATVGPMAEQFERALLDVLQRNPPPEVLEAIRNRAQSGATDLITNLTQAEINKVQAQIAEAAAQGRGPREVARFLDEVKGLDDNRARSYAKYIEELEQSGLSDADIERRAEAYYKKLLRDRKETIAQTEMRKGTSEIRKAEAEARGASMKVWQTVGDDRVSDECQACEAQGPIPIDEAFASGADTPPNHPSCRCTVSYYSNEALTPVYEERAAARAERTAEAKGQTGGDADE